LNSIGFRKRDGSEGEGLTDPTIILWDRTWPAGDEKPRQYDVSKLALEYRDANLCEAGIAPLNCDDGPFLCYYTDYNIWSNRKKQWVCGMPIKGEKSLDSLGLP
jgi:hypothetical protein